MEPDEGMDEDEPTFPWLPPDDRLWRHPSEVAVRPSTWEAGGRPTGTGAGTGIGTGTMLREADRRLWTVALLAGVLGAVLASGAGVVVGQYHHSTTVVRPIEQIISPSSPVLTVAASSPKDAVVDIAERLRPTIVQLLVNGNGSNGSGSGVIFRSDGYILTNSHVVDGAQSVTAVLSDGHKVDCRLVGSDRATDIAVVKMKDNRSDQVATLGSSTQLRVGQLAIAIGDPLGLAGGPSVTSGIVSATDRQVSSGSSAPLLDMIQTDAAIEPGSSGGALVDANGMVIGITTAIALGDQSAQTVGFATPIELARDVANQILTNGKVTHTWLGLEGADVDDSTARQLHISGGAVVSNVDSDSPALRAGVAPTDVVTAVDMQTVSTMNALEMNIRLRRPGDHVSLTFIHDGVVHITDVQLLERPYTDYP
ncbi:MAG TPA: trypsin-like peptidase domain-containing protein [Acidimicrobiales bacterium]|nr:trypsin-like peptidase domain-containing protein [Acidimicrobiales bacterium]